MGECRVALAHSMFDPLSRTSVEVEMRCALVGELSCRRKAEGEEIEMAGLEVTGERKQRQRE